MDVYNLVYLLFRFLGLRWHIWTYIIWYTYCLGVGITVEHMDVYHLVYVLFRCWDYGGAYGRISLGIPTV